MWSVSRTRVLSAVSRGRRALSAGSPADATRLAAVLARADAAWDGALDAEWVDAPEAAALVDDIAQLVDDYRPMYRAEAVAGGGEAKEVYDAVARVHKAGEAAKLVGLYAGHMESLLRDHMDMCGPLGNRTALTAAAAARASDTLMEYVSFVSAIDDVRLRRKTESQLGRKVIQLRQTLSVENFSATHFPIATDHMRTSKSPPAVPPGA